jgi:epidermal growth factor receptor substrate 15
VQIWQIADRENRGFLTPAGFGIVLRLIGHAQAGREPTAELALQHGPLPRFDGIANAPAPTAPIVPQPTAAASPALQPQGTGPIRIPPLTPEKVAQYTNLFERQTLQAGGMLPGDQAKQIFEKSALPNEALGKIWQLADTEQRGALVLTEFVIAMHLLTSIKTGALRGLPNILPAALYEAATRRGPVQRQSPTTTGTISAIPRQLSGSAQMRTGSPLGRSPLGPQAAGSQSDWLITPAEKTRFDQLYNDVDKTQKGFITGEEAVPFFGQSNLAEDTLAQIWDLADINSEGRLNKDEFAVAMYLIRQQRSRRDGSNTLPAVLPANLVPPSMRTQVRPPTANSAFDLPPLPPQPPAPKSALDDLFGLDASQPLPPPAQTQTALSTGGSAANDPFSLASNVLVPASPAKPSPTGTSFRPFVPSSSFGRGLTAQATGDSTGSGPTALPKSTPGVSAPQDLLGDTDPEISRKLTNEATELANLSNQIGSLSKQTQEIQSQRVNTQNELSQATSQKKNFEQRLSQLRALYEKEASDVRSLETQLAAARNDTKKLQAECLSLEGTSQDLQGQHRQVLAALKADQQENANFKEKIRATNAEIAQLKPQIEKLKSEARQQKGLVAINKKQLATNEAERDKLKTEAEDIAKSNEDLSRQLNTSSPIPAAPPVQIASPTPSTASGNNPFFRRTGSTDIMGTFQSPPIKSYTDKSFDDVFGPSFPAPTSTPPPATSFKQQDTGTSTASVGSFATPGTSTPNVSRQVTFPAEPSAPAEPRQVGSNIFPFTDRAESLASSSPQASPPVSRSGPDVLPTDSKPGVIAFPIESVITGPGPSLSENALKISSPSPSEVKLSNGSATAPTDATASSTVTTAESDPFGALDQAKAKSDFDNAFASFTNAHKAQDKAATDPVKTSAAFNTEFPPISELERDEDSDTASEQGGFDDDFAPASPRAKSTAGKQSFPPTALKAAAPAALQPSLPITSAEPEKKYAIFAVPIMSNKADDTCSARPSLPTSPFDASPFGEQSKVDDIFGGPLPTTPAGSQVVAPVVPSKAPFDDLDDDFEGLEDAKEGSADDDFASISRSGLDDFNAVFDSSPPATQAKSDSTAFGVESSFDFGSVSASSATGTASSTANLGAASSVAQPKAPAPPDAHDWDAIFASLDSPSDSAATATNSTAKEAPKPALARALTEDGVHDDPILKNLTSMGYSRSDALLALEKYDYNLERVSLYPNSMTCI